LSGSTYTYSDAIALPMSEQRVILDVAGLGTSLPLATGDQLVVNRDISFQLGAGEFLSIVGPSGGGKTTLLRAISGLLAPAQGTVSHEGEHLRGVPSWLSIVFQDYGKALFPWLSVRKNCGLAIREVEKSEAHRRVDEVLARVGLLEFGDSYPWELSGGMQQRVAFARAIVSNPQVVLMDEPFASVDALTRRKLEDLALELWEAIGCSVVLITHDIGEAVYMSDRVLALSTRPSTVIGDINIDLPRPRDRETTMQLPRYHELHRILLSLVEGTDGDERDTRSVPATRESM
jgi:NitT/TauT family transport system ATP-binding protein